MTNLLNNRLQSLVERETSLQQICHLDRSEA
jgi:hypothetical protein